MACWHSEWKNRHLKLLYRFRSRYVWDTRALHQPRCHNLIHRDLLQSRYDMMQCRQSRPILRVDLKLRILRLPRPLDSRLWFSLGKAIEDRIVRFSLAFVRVAHAGDISLDENAGVGVVARHAAFDTWFAGSRGFDGCEAVELKATPGRPLPADADAVRGFVPLNINGRVQLGHAELFAARDDWVGETFEQQGHIGA